MRGRRIVAAALVGTVVVAIGVLTASLSAQDAAAPALRGTVSSVIEGPMEGVLVTVRRDGANHAVTVVSDAQGRYSFPHTHLEPGPHALTIRAIRYDLVDAGPVTVTAGQTTTRDLALVPTADLGRQLTSLDWALNMSGTPEQKDQFIYQGKSCNYCHSYQRIMRTKHTADQWVRVIERMNSYYPDGTAVSDDGRGWGQPLVDYGDSYGQPTPDGPNEGRGDRWGSWDIAELGRYLETINLSGERDTWPFPIVTTLPRPTGTATRVIVTQWDQPRRVTTSHDMDVDSQGRVWYGDEAHQFVGMLDPKAHEFKEYPLPAVPDRHLPGTRDVQVDKDDNVWFPMRVAGGASLLTKLDPRTGRIETVKDATAQFIALGPGDKMWIGGAGNPFKRVDMKTMTLEASFEGSGYQVVVNSKGNPYMSSRGVINYYDVSAGQAKQFLLPHDMSHGRRGRMDDQDRYWFAEYRDDKIGMFDTRTETLRRWPLREYFTPYAASVPDRDGHIWTGSNMSHRLARLDPDTGEVVEYLMPTEIDIKKFAFDPTAKGRVVVLAANMRNARILRVELLD